MNQMKKLISMLDDDVYEILWKSEHTKEYLNDFMNAFFNVIGSSSVKEFEILENDLFASHDDELKKRIHLTFIYEQKRYYYEIKISNSKDMNKYFDFTLIPFANYCWKNTESDIHVGQIILNFNEEDIEEPISYHVIKNEELDDNGVEIHVISLPLLKSILKDKSLLELNRFERWILLFSAENTLEVQGIVQNFPIMKTFFYIWKQESKRILLERNNATDELRLNYLLEEMKDKTKVEIAQQLLKQKCPVPMIMKATGLSYDEIQSLNDL